MRPIRQPSEALRVLLIDNYDSFTYLLADYLKQAHCLVEVVRPDGRDMDGFRHLSCDALVLSPGPGRPETSGLLMSVLAHYMHRVPRLGVCLGMQAIGLHWGGRLVRDVSPKHGKTSVIECTPDPIFDGLPVRMEVMRYHSLVLEGLAGTPLEVLAATDEGIPMALRHPELPVWGVQFHPESILTIFGREIIRNWATFARLTLGTDETV
jgi:anthranilate synthase component 2